MEAEETLKLKTLKLKDYKNLRDFEISFSSGNSPYTVLIGQNGTGKSNLFETIGRIFYSLSFGESVNFSYSLDYFVKNYLVSIECNLDKSRFKTTAIVEKIGISSSRKRIPLKYLLKFGENGDRLLPSLIFGYYSGLCSRFQEPFMDYQKKFTNQGKKIEAGNFMPRYMMYCSSDQADLLLIGLKAHDIFEGNKVSVLDTLGIEGIDELRLKLRPPAKFDPRTDLPATMGLKGSLKDLVTAFNNFSDGVPTSDSQDPKSSKIYRFTDKGLGNLAEMASKRNTNLFSLLYEARHQGILENAIFDLVIRGGHNIHHDVLSEGQRQLLLVLGMLKFSRHDEALFLLDEPDTHLNPQWQYGYLNLIREWTSGATDSANCHVIVTSHNPLTISSLQKDEVRVLFLDKMGNIRSLSPYVSPRGMGFTSTLTEIFGLASSLDSDTQSKLDERDFLLLLEKRTNEQNSRLMILNDELVRLGFMYEDREPTYQKFLHAMHDFRNANTAPLSPDEIEVRRKTLEELYKVIYFSREDGK